MARSIIDDISSSRTTYGSDGSDELTIEKARENYRTQAAKRNNELIKKNIEEQVKLENALREKGIKEGSDAWKKAMEKNQKDLVKLRQIEELKELRDTYEYEKQLQKELLEEKYKLNQDIMASEDATMKEKMKAWGANFAADFKSNAKEGFAKGVNNFVNSLTQGLDTLMESYAQYQGRVNARIQGMGKSFTSMENTLSGAVGIQPYVKNQLLVENLYNLVDSGIAYNVELRAFLETVSENIATTFDATNGTLLRLIRIQQSDSTAARLGLEARLTNYFNRMYQNTEYLSNSFDTVSAALLEASSTMGNDRAIQFEYQVQKWLGSLYGVGMSDETVAGIAQALGMLGAGDITGLSGSQYQNLLMMAIARTPGVSVDSILQKGITASETNSILKSLVLYLQELASGSTQVVRAELAKTFGVNISDLTAALNLNTSALEDISSQAMNYSSAINELSNQLNAMPGRLPLSTMLSNIWSNVQWGQASNIVSNPAMYAIWKVTSLIQENTGGINVPSIFAMGSGFNLNTTIENLVKLGVVGISSLGMIGDLISGLGSTFSPASMLSKLGGTSMSRLTVVGSGLTSDMSGMSTSSTVIAGNASGEDIYSSAKGEAQGAAQAEADAQKSEGDDITELTKYIKEDVHAIYELLGSVIDYGGSMKTSAVYDSTLPGSPGIPMP